MPPKQFVRSSKFRHVFGTAPKKEFCYDNIRITKNSWDSPFCAANPKFVAVVTEASGGGSFLVLPAERVGRLPQEYPQVVGHTSLIMDLAWNPFDDNMIASGSDDTTIKIWEIPDGGLTSNLEKPVLSLEQHHKKVGHVVWHPTASNILLSASHDNLILIWNLETGEAVIEINCHPDLIYSVSWDTNGSRIVTTCKDKKIRIIDVRKDGDNVTEAEGHEGAKPQRAAFCGNLNMIFTSGFSKMSSRQLGVWKADNLEQLALEEIDNGNGVQFVHYDPDTKMIYLCGKGDSTIRYYELVPEEPYWHFLTMYTSTISQRGVCFMPKRGVDVNSNEIAKAFKLVSSGAKPGYCEPLSFKVQRKSELFQGDIFPDCPGDEPALTADEWLEGKNADPKLMCMEDKFKGKTSGSGRKTGSKGLAKKTKVADSSKASAEDEVDLLEMQAQIKKLQHTVEAQEKRIKALEEKD